MAFSSSILRNTLAALESSGIATRPLLMGIVDASKLGQDFWLTDEAFFTILMRAAQASSEPGLGLSIGRRGANWAGFGAAGMHISLLRSFAEAVQAMVRFNGAFRDRQDLFVLQDGQTIGVQLGPFDAPLPARQFLCELGLAAMAELLQRFAGPDARPLAVSLDYREPLHADMYTQVFGCPVHFGQARSSLVVARALAEREQALFQPELAAELGRLAEANVTGGDKPLAMVKAEAALCIAERVRACVQRGNQSDAPSMPVVALELGISERSLRRHLARVGLDFRSILAQNRLEVAREMLRKGMVVKQVACELGYRSPSAFHRAFRRWAGSTPAAFAFGERALESLQGSPQRSQT